MVVLAAACYAGAVTVAASDGNDGQPLTTVRDTVRVLTERFVRDSVDITRGSAVLFINEEGTHNVLFAGAGSPADIPRAATWRVARSFMVHGRVEFLCSIHPTMNGVVLVR